MMYDVHLHGQMYQEAGRLLGSYQTIEECRDRAERALKIHAPGEHVGALVSEDGEPLTSFELDAAGQLCELEL